MTRLNAANNAVSKLASGINSAATILTVEDGSLFPEPPFLITIEDEIIQVGDKNGNAFSDLLRGAEGTTPAAHNAGVNVDNRFTAGTYDALATTEDLSTHINDANNPHNVTAAQTGAETPSGAQAKVDTHEQKAAPHSGHETPDGAQAKVDAHAGLQDNPHEVTAAQVGAETPAGAQAKVDAHADDVATIDALGHVKVDGETITASNGIISAQTQIVDTVTSDKWKWGMEDGIVFLEKVVE